MAASARVMAAHRRLVCLCCRDMRSESVCRCSLLCVLLCCCCCTRRLRHCCRLDFALHTTCDARSMVAHTATRIETRPQQHESMHACDMSRDKLQLACRLQLVQASSTAHGVPLLFALPSSACLPYCCYCCRVCCVCRECECGGGCEVVEAAGRRGSQRACLCLSATATLSVRVGWWAARCVFPLPLCCVVWCCVMVRWRVAIPLPHGAL